MLSCNLHFSFTSLVAVDDIAGRGGADVLVPGSRRLQRQGKSNHISSHFSIISLCPQLPKRIMVSRVSPWMLKLYVLSHLRNQAWTDNWRSGLFGNQGQTILILFFWHKTGSWYHIIWRHITLYLTYIWCNISYHIISHPISYHIIYDILVNWDHLYLAFERCVSLERLSHPEV